MKQNYYPRFRGQNRGTKRLSNLPSSGVHAPLLASVPFKDNSEGYKVILQFLGDTQIGYVFKKKKIGFITL